MDDALYRDEILDHYRSSPYRGRLDAPDGSGEADSPLCGDRVRLELALDASGRIVRVAFEGEGCAISQAAASMLAERVEGLSVDEARAFTSDDALGLLRVQLTPVRIKCALLGWHALQHALPRDTQGDFAKRGLDGAPGASQS
jgi:nitrogen fixation protein NifU and related proteins